MGFIIRHFVTVYVKKMSKRSDLLQICCKKTSTGSIFVEFGDLQVFFCYIAVEKFM